MMCCTRGVLIQGKWLNLKQDRQSASCHCDLSSVHTCFQVGSWHSHQVTQNTPLLGEHPRERKASSPHQACMQMIRAVLFVTAAKCKEPKCPQLMHGSTNLAFPYPGIVLSQGKKWSFDTYAAWMSPENSLLDERSQSQRSHTAWVHLQEKSRRSKSLGGQGRVQQGTVNNHKQVQSFFPEMIKQPKLRSWCRLRNCEYTKTRFNWNTLKWSFWWFVNYISIKNSPLK